MKKQKKILFLIPPYFNADDYVSLKTSVLPAFTIPYGILSIQTYLNKKLGAKIKVDILDLNICLRDLLESGKNTDYTAEFEKTIIKKLTQFSPDIVGLSALFNSSNRYLEWFASIVKNHNTNIVTIAGGGLPSAAFDKVLRDCKSIDAICKGEGEIPLEDLLTAKNYLECLETHRSWVTLKSLEEGKIPSHSFIENLDEIPFLNYDIVDLNDYNNRGIDKQFVNEENVIKREMAIHTSRGCPFLCVFCSNPSLHGQKIRTMSVEKVINDVKRMKEEYGMTVLMIEDDHFFGDPNRAKQILKGLAELNIRIEFPNGLAVYAIDDDMAKHLSEAGVSAVALAVESGSDFVLDQIIKKPLKKRLIKPAVDSLRRFGVKAHVFIVSGLPGETDEHREETVQMLLDNGFDWAHIYLAIPIFGSRLYDICIENGYIEKQDTKDHIATKAIIKTPTVDPEKLEKFAYETQLKVNFVENYNMKIGSYEVAHHYFENVIQKYPDHALGHHFIGECKLALGQTLDAKHHFKLARDIIIKDDFWSKTAQDLGVKVKIENEYLIKTTPA